MKISVITATYNSSDHIASCLNSVNSQTYPNIEHIIIDGASKDNTIEIIKETPNHVSNINSEPDGGIYDALNKGINFATGDIIGFLHSDDIFDSPKTLQKIAKVFLEDPSISVLYGDLVFVDAQNTGKVLRYWKSQPFKLSLLIHGWMPPHPTVFMRREVYEQHGLFDVSFKCAADYDFLLRILKDPLQKIKYIPEVIIKMRIGGISTKGFRNILNKKFEDLRVLRKNKLPFPLWTLIFKNISKIPQLFLRQ